MTLRFVIAAAAVALLAPVALAQSSTPKGTLIQQASLFKQGKWRAMYATYTPRYRRACPYARFVAMQRQARRLVGTNFRIQGVQVRRETSSRAIVAYRFVRGASTIARVSFLDRDVYTRIGSRWYDELDRTSFC